MPKTRPVFVTGGTGYIGGALIRALIERGYQVYGLVRRGSEARLPAKAVPVIGNALDASTFVNSIPADATVVHLVGTPHPSPRKAAEFQSVDLASIQATTAAAQQAGVRHFVYVSVAHPAPVMHAYIAVREQGKRW
jgi:nucleoside-diphosphate-sugar epimerase